MVRVSDLLISLLLIVGCRADRMADCAGLCGAKMTLDCCECIGCHQGMRFGKRSAPFLLSDRYGEENEPVSRNLEVASLLHKLIQDSLERRENFQKILNANGYYAL